jgi:hypothetical protein
MVEIAARRLAPARPASFGVPPPGPVIGDPPSLPEPNLGPCPAEPPVEAEPEPLWLKLPADLAPWFELGFCHTDTICPCVVLLVRDDDQRQSVEVSGPPEAFLALAEMIAALCKSVPCLSRDARGGAALGETG